MRAKHLQILISTLLAVVPLSLSNPLQAAQSRADAEIAADLAHASQELQRMSKRRADKAPPEQDLRKIESEFISLLNRAPENPEVIDAVRAFYKDWLWSMYSPQMQGPSPAFLDIVERSPDPSRLALRLVEGRYDPAVIATLMAALAARPRDVVLLVHTAEAFREPAWKVALAEEAYRQWLASSLLTRPEDLDVAAALAGKWLNAQMDAGLAARAAATFTSLPSRVRDRLLTSVSSPVQATIGGLPFQGEVPDWRLDAAAAFLIAGDVKKASELVGQVPEEESKPSFLEIPIAELRRDTDRDGLTDLAEEGLLTDPESPDTDGDGFADAADPLPGVPWSRDPSPAAQALATFLATISGTEQQALIEGLPGPKVLCCPGDRPALASENTDFYIGDRTLFAGLDPNRRLVVLTKEEASAAREKFGPFFPKSISLFLLDRTGRRAYIIWSASWAGGEVALEEKDGEWTAHETSSWIT